MRRQGIKSAILLTVLCLAAQALPGTAWGQTTGKLAGTVREADTGDPLPGVTVSLQGTTRGTTTDVDGNYVIVGLTPGQYDIRFSFVGFTPQVVDNVLITSDRTATLDVTLGTQVIQGGEVVIEAARPVVDASQTTSRSLVTSEEMSRLPVSNLQQVISRTANSYEGYVRGSRRFETKTIVEGIDVSDTFYQLAPNATSTSFTGNVYNNTNKAGNTNSALFTLNPDGLEEVTVNAGAQDARYSSASGGVVAVTLAEGRGPIQGSATFRFSPSVPRPGPDSLTYYSEADAQTYFKIKADKEAANDPSARFYTWTPDKYAANEDPEIDARVQLGGSITNNWTFNLNGQLFQTNGFMPNEYRKRLNGQIKTSYQVASKTRLTAIGLVEDNGLWGGWNNTTYVDFYRFCLECIAQNDAGSYLGSLRLTQIFSERSFMDVQYYRTFAKTRWGYVDDDGDGFQELGEDGDFLDFTDEAVVKKYVGIGTDKTKMFYENESDPFADTGLLLPGGLRFRGGQPQPYSEFSTQATHGFRVDYTNQINFNHLINTGVELKLRDFDYQEVYGMDQSGSKLNTTVEPYKLSEWNRKPWELSLYASDRMEYAGLIVNLGARVDFVNRDMEKIPNMFYPFRRDTVNTWSVPLARNNFVREGAVPTDVFFNPSVGVSHPIGTNAAMYFSYSRNQQLLPYNSLYYFYDGNTSNSPFFTYPNPEAEPITSNNYELGLQWEFSPGWGADVNAYMRSIDNYGRATLRAVNQTPTGNPTLVGAWHDFYTPAGYADVRGIELVLRRAPLRLAEDFTFGLTASYTFSSVEEANFAGANITEFRVTEGQPTVLPFDNVNDFKNFPQNVRGGSSTLTGGYDRTHRFVVRSVSGLPLGFSLGLSGNLETGFLYRRVLDVDPRDRELNTGPTNYQLDLRLEKRFRFTNRFGIDAYLDVINLTDRQNIIAFDDRTPDGQAVFEATGSPGYRLILKDGTALYGPARMVYFGTRLRF